MNWIKPGKEYPNVVTTSIIVSHIISNVYSVRLFLFHARKRASLSLPPLAIHIIIQNDVQYLTRIEAKPHLFSQWCHSTTSKSCNFVLYLGVITETFTAQNRALTCCLLPLSLLFLFQYPLQTYERMGAPVLDWTLNSLIQRARIRHDKSLAHLYKWKTKWYSPLWG